MFWKCGKYSIDLTPARLDGKKFQVHNYEGDSAIALQILILKIELWYWIAQKASPQLYENDLMVLRIHTPVYILF